MKFKTPYTENQKSIGEINTRPSQTIPDQAMSVREMLDRHTRGLPMEGVKVPIYDGENDIFNGVDPRKLDLTELQDLRDQVVDRIKEAKRLEKQAQKDEYTKKQQQAIEDAVKSRIEAQNTQKTGEQPV